MITSVENETQSQKRWIARAEFPRGRQWEAVCDKREDAVGWANAFMLDEFYDIRIQLEESPDAKGS